ncbi:NUDIX hydrolase [Psychroserpens sp.]|uniref:NUDIX hydrolase n=1 Tax=Psychroserpens sp. TaxID=2020870 RepID=UPI002B26F95A|nr:NUDIX domain-containing protein [Psychroserpens sp.]
MEENIDIVDQNGKPTGVSVLKSEIHTKGHLHNTAHVWFYTSEGNILLQQRAASKAICPLLWDVSVAGHVDAGERVEHAAIREAKEEIGIHMSENQLLKIGVFECFQSYANGIIDNELHNTFIAKVDVNIDDLTPQKEEVEALKFVSLSEFKILLNASEINNHFVSSNRKYYEFVFEAIKANLTP